MNELAKECLKDNKELYKKYLAAEIKYYKKIGDKYEEITIEIDYDEEIYKSLFTSLAKANICFDDYLLCLLKIEIIRKEMEKNEKAC